MAEMLDLFDAKGQPTGVTIRRGESAPEGMYWAVSDVWIVNRKGEVLIQQRAYNKPTFPGKWCDSAGGAVVSGETPEESCIRETQEEIGVTPDFSRGGKVFEFLSRRGLHHVFLFCQDVPLESLRLQQEEVAAVQYADAATIRLMVKNGCFASIDYLEQLLQMLPILTSMYGKDD